MKPSTRLDGWNFVSLHHAWNLIKRRSFFTMSPDVAPALPPEPDTRGIALGPGAKFEHIL
jgi:hypothetical protein